jgi:putative pyruvate formate lyase activating enzyme
MDGLYAAYEACGLCPHRCGINRTQKKVGICRESDAMRIAWIGLHRGEEPPVSGIRGSGTIFFCGCPLHCAYCQNCQISGVQDEVPGVTVSVEDFASCMLGLQDMGATNLNMVTGTHFIPSIIQALKIARERGLELPVVWNSSGYESVEGLSLIDPYVSLYLIDVKTLDTNVAARFCGTARYASEIEKTMDYLLARHQRTALDAAGNLQGILVRHLMFPGTIEATKQFLHWFATKAKSHAWLSLMVQFVPPKQDDSLPEITEESYDELMDMLEMLGIDDGFVQELADNIPWIPDFRRENPFPDSFAEPLDAFLKLKNP